jgi:hypothetical protein
MTLNRFCTNCSAKCLAGAKFCQECGHQIPSQEESSALHSTESFFQGTSWKYIQLLAGFLVLIFAGSYFLASESSPPPAITYETIDSTNQSYESGLRPCDRAGDSTANGRYVGLGGYWVEQQVREIEPTRQGRWITNCVNLKVPNSNYDARKGFSAFVNEPYLNQEQCNQAYVYE